MTMPIHTMHGIIGDDTERLSYWKQEYQKKSELYDELKEQYTTEKKRADEATERERRLLELLDRILDKTDGYSAYSNEAYIHSWIREMQRSLYGADSA
ncbi:hypothetical protein PAV_15c00940 [Paenibacillus alvei DSM 29]|uniref:hypothetical protein n=1 Tax=Paenibacillus alvei TaxID=44250 RepID=UPI0002898737|nr:hypothetical protein [Paenibacillus alvei]EJW14305.1 hypothetical protein PAV_15c00940 [Paenibacillus alvei DSM 29]